jgi:hypothetical protein
VAEGVLRVTVASAEALATVGRNQLLHRFTITVRPGASGTQQLRMVTLDLRDANGNVLAPRRSVDFTFRVQ